MAVIGKIRKHSLLLIIVIGVALAAFVLGDFATGTNRTTYYVGTIAGDEITINDFNRKYDENVEASKRQSQTDRIPPEELGRIRETTWTQLVQEILMAKEYERVGVSITPDELFYQIQGPNPHIAVIQNFINPETGQYDREMVIRYLQNLDQMPQQNKDQWLTFERYVKDDRIKTKYQNLIVKGYYVPNAFAKLTYEEKNDKASAEVIGIRFTTVADSLIELTDKDYKTYYDQYKVNFDQPASRDIEYVVFDVVPSDKDMNDAEQFVTSMVDEFRQTDNITGFVNANSDNRYDSTWFGPNEIPVIMEQALFNAEIGSVHGPFFDNGAYQLARLVDITFRPDSMKASHILVAFEGSLRSNQTRSKEDAARRADSLLTVIKRKPSLLTELASSVSDDASGAQNQGDLGWFKDGQMVAPFNSFVHDNKIGTLGIVETDFGYHIVEVTGKKEPAKKIKAAIITHLVTPSTQTYQETFAKASKFATESKTKAQFDASIESLGMSKRIANALRSDAYNIAGIQNARQIIRWAFDEKTSMNDVSTIFDLDNMYVVAALTKVVEKGIPDLADVKEMIKPQVLNHKKGEYIVERMQAYANDFDQMATAFNTQKTDVPSLTFDSRSFAGFGQEPKAIGELFALRPAATSKPFAGSNAAFIIKMKDITKASERSNYDQIRKELASSFEQLIRNNVAFRAIEKANDIEDNRLMFF